MNQYINLCVDLTQNMNSCVCIYTIEYAYQYLFEATAASLTLFLHSDFLSVIHIHKAIMSTHIYTEVFEPKYKFMHRFESQY